ncbi:hypothetical protein Q7P37_004038 [Cladosporium fusiforme]
MLKSIFYARFHPERGPDVLHQFPEGSVARASSSSGSGIATAAASTSIATAPSLLSLAAATNTTATTPPLVPFPPISAYIIPPHELSNQPLAICAEGYRILGFPISIEGEGYERNRFVCNVCFVLDEQEGDVEGWQRVVRRMAAFMRGLEVEGEGEGGVGMLRAEERRVDEWIDNGERDEEAGFLVVSWILREVFEQLNAFSECCVRVSATQVLNLRREKSSARQRDLTKLNANASGNGSASTGKLKINAWDVPLIVRELPNPAGWTWDLVLEQIYPHINGTNPVARIARLADVDLPLVRKAVRELVSHARAIVLDLFHFQAVYALTREFPLFVAAPALIDECRAYVAVDPGENFFASITPQDVRDACPPMPDRATILELYSVLKPGLAVADFFLAHQDLLANIDIRRLITFGVIKGFVRRLHKFALAVEPPAPNLPPPAPAPADAEIDRTWRAAALSSGWATPPASVAAAAEGLLDREVQREREVRAVLARGLDGRTCLDGVCLGLGEGEARVLERVRGGGFGEVVVFLR